MTGLNGPRAAIAVLPVARNSAVPFKYESMHARLVANSVPAPSTMRALDGVPCRLWSGSLAGGVNGRYGKISIRLKVKRNGARPIKTRLAHRVSYADSRGVPLYTLGYVRHLCNVALCIEPQHLVSGTQKANIRQCVAEGRHVSGFGILASRRNEKLVGKRGNSESNNSVARARAVD